MPRALNLTGIRFGRLVAIAQVRVDGDLGWRCLCDCGREVELATERLRVGTTRSCGCLRRELTARLWRLAPPTPKTHGAVADKWPEYNIWQAMKQRCANPKDRSFVWYGARGISVCPAWRASFRAFINDMGRRPSSKHSIDRINNDGNYEPGNCRWATIDIQARNKRPRTKASAP